VQVARHSRALLLTLIWRCDDVQVLSSLQKMQDKKKTNALRRAESDAVAEFTDVSSTILQKSLAYVVVTVARMYVLPRCCHVFVCSRVPLPCSAVATLEKQQARRLRELKANMQRELEDWSAATEKWESILGGHKAAFSKV
jgi:hypothetical protein